METFEYGDRVEHKLHGTGKALNSYPNVNLIQVDFDDDTGDEKRIGRLVHPVSLTKVPVHHFHILIRFTNGDMSSMVGATKQDIKDWLRQLDWDKIDEYTVTRHKTKEEREGN